VTPTAVAIRSSRKFVVLGSDFEHILAQQQQQQQNLATLSMNPEFYHNYYNYIIIISEP
jgi:hypothetical protein